MTPAWACEGSRRHTNVRTRACARESARVRVERPEPDLCAASPGGPARTGSDSEISRFRVARSLTTAPLPWSRLSESLSLHANHRPAAAVAAAERPASQTTPNPRHCAAAARKRLAVLRCDRVRSRARARA